MLVSSGQTEVLEQLKGERPLPRWLGAGGQAGALTPTLSAPSSPDGHH